MPEKFEINIDKKEVKNTIKDVEKNAYFNRIAEQVKKIRSGQIDEAFKGNASKWKNLFHSIELDKYDDLILSVLREEYQEYQKYIEPIKQLIGFHKLNLKKTIEKIKLNEKNV